MAQVKCPQCGGTEWHTVDICPGCLRKTSGPVTMKIYRRVETEDELWLKALAQVAIEEAERPERGFFKGDTGLVRFALLWMDECAEKVWR